MHDFSRLKVALTYKESIDRIIVYKLAVKNYVLNETEVRVRHRWAKEETFRVPKLATCSLCGKLLGNFLHSLCAYPRNIFHEVHSKMRLWINLLSEIRSSFKITWKSMWLINIKQTYRMLWRYCHVLWREKNSSIYIILLYLFAFKFFMQKKKKIYTIGMCKVKSGIARLLCLKLNLP